MESIVNKPACDYWIEILKMITVMYDLYKVLFCTGNAPVISQCILVVRCAVWKNEFLLCFSYQVIYNSLLILSLNCFNLLFRMLSVVASHFFDRCLRMWILITQILHAYELEFILPYTNSLKDCFHAESVNDVTLFISGQEFISPHSYRIQ